MASDQAVIAPLRELLIEAAATAADDDRWAQLGSVDFNLSRLASEFDTHKWGYSKLSDLLAAQTRNWWRAAGRIPAKMVMSPANGAGRRGR
ncbi:OST-HTH/LOTUS domain-containing protein [Demequina aurantiaca]|uniref:OST-HTH/LOTUS domain-containing protein n=1 Tax=Demequina aurantiaca TaxID=676200 RepID=UPI003D353D16